MSLLTLKCTRHESESDGVPCLASPETLLRCFCQPLKLELLFLNPCGCDCLVTRVLDPRHLETIIPHSATTAYAFVQSPPSIPIATRDEQRRAIRTRTVTSPGRRVAVQEPPNRDGNSAPEHAPAALDRLCCFMNGWMAPSSGSFIWTARMELGRAQPPTGRSASMTRSAVSSTHASTRRIPTEDVSCPPRSLCAKDAGSELGRWS